MSEREDNIFSNSHLSLFFVDFIDTPTENLDCDNEFLDIESENSDNNNKNSDNE
ncbi:hypothetical protein Glove_227g122 [Diversispora epigaea]|uniref:Uncharacterized protein n=1 Tax=Diversispora epigaea TaxID=1348612 RepID=A0A397IH81_9GLOM|nr:hypothetical protein Glove_227g122 [Diversispora epigaea]